MNGTGTRPETIDTLRDAIAGIDRDIVALMRRRLDAACALGREKQLAGMPIADPKREAAVLRQVTLLARHERLDPERVRDVFWCLIGMCRASQFDAALEGDHA